MNLDAEQAINDLLDKIAFIERQKAALEMQLKAAERILNAKEETGDDESV